LLQIGPLSHKILTLLIILSANFVKKCLWTI